MNFQLWTTREIWNAHAQLGFEQNQQGGDKIHLDRTMYDEETPDRRVLMLSGGIGSCGALYHMIPFFDHFEVAHVENRFVDEALNLERKRCCVNVLGMSKNRDGKHLLTQKDKSVVSWCHQEHSFQPNSFQQVAFPLEWKMLYMMACVLESNNELETVHFYWGSYDERMKPMLNFSLDLFPGKRLRHFFPVVTKDRALFSVAKGEADGCRMMRLYNSYYQPNSMGSCLPYQVSNRLVSCRRKETRFDEPIPANETAFQSLFLLNQSSNKPFYSCCSACRGCLAFSNAWNTLKRTVPTIRLGAFDENNGPGDDRRISNASSIKSGFGNIALRKKEIRDAFRGKNLEHNYSEFEKSKKAAAKNNAAQEDDDDEDENIDDDAFFSEAMIDQEPAAEDEGEDPVEKDDDSDESSEDEKNNEDAAEEKTDGKKSPVFIEEFEE